MAIGFGDTGLDFMRSVALGGGEGILNCGSSLTGDELACFFNVPPGG